MSKRILLCDDECYILHAAEIKFSRAGFDVRCAADGEEAWGIMQEWIPDVLITDCQMPNLDGIALTRRCREHESTRELPILMLTAKGFELPHEELTLQLGILAVIPKPFSPRELVSCVEQVIETGTCPRVRNYV